MFTVLSKDSWLPAAIKMSIVASVFLLMPSYLDIISRQFNAPIERLTYLATLELLGFAIAPFICLFANKLKIILKENVSIILLVVCHIASIYCKSVDLFFIVRTIAGICAGIALVRSFEVLAHNPHPESAFAKAIATQMLYSAVMFVIIPSLSERFGIQAFFSTLALLSALLLVLPNQQPVMQAFKQVKEHPINYRLLTMGILAVLMFMTAHSGAWSMLGIISTGHQLSIQTQGNVLAIGTLFSLFGAILSAIVVNYYHDRRVLVLVSLIIQMAIFALLFNALNTPVYMFAVAMFMLLWNFILPLLLGTVALTDESGGAMRFVVAAQTIGAALGPSVLLKGWILLELILLLLVTLILIYPLIQKKQTIA